ncbi:MupA/Atu3671 family FMN-dependent luciferase-like monooxygenase [Kribbella sp. NPDC020789]
MDFSLFYFADYADDSHSDRYRLLLDGAQFADDNGFAAVWTPERHFHHFGGIYPNPSVTGAAVAATTRRVQIRAGSVVLPLQHPLRVAEEWSVVDNLSNGRAGISFAPGWGATDFALRPDRYADRKSIMKEEIDQVRRLWRGESLSVADGLGKTTEVRTFPRPVQPELPVWISSSGDIETFRLAGRLKTGVLTHLLTQQPEQLEEKIAAYREAAREESGWAGHVVLMLHTFVGEDDDVVRGIVKPPLERYLRSSLELVFGPRDGGVAAAQQLRPGDVEFMVERSFDRYFERDGLLGGTAKVRAAVERFRALGVDELACLIDFGVPREQVLNALKHLNELRLACG